MSAENEIIEIVSRYTRAADWRGGEALAKLYEADVADVALGRLSRFLQVDFLDGMPRDPNGKLYKRRLRDPLLDRPRLRALAGETPR